MFKIINDNHSAKVKRFILDMLSPLISEVDTVSQDLLDVILSQIVEPIKSQNRSACSLAQDILKRNVSTLEPYIQEFFNNALKGKTFQSGVSRQVYELTYELNTICPSMLVVVLPQLEAKIEVFEEEERIKVCKILARMFGEKNSTLLEQN
ncbi:Sister chromatid cohesion protein PDS5-like protein, partial [Stegodyphus mimosarum]